MHLSHALLNDMSNIKHTSPGAGQAFEVPEETYETIETMLPSGKGHFLELWAKRGYVRPGWTHIAEMRNVQTLDTDLLK